MHCCVPGVEMFEMIEHNLGRIISIDFNKVKIEIRLLLCKIRMYTQASFGKHAVTIKYFFILKYLGRNLIWKHPVILYIL